MNPRRGFFPSVRAPAARFLIGTLRAGLALLLASPASAMHVASGTYSGTTLPRTISGVGFQPAVVIVKGNTNQPAVIKTQTMGGTYSKFFDTSLFGYDNGIRSLNPDGFTVGTSGAVNALLTSYTFVAIEATPGELAVGSYIGDGGAARTISGLGFSPAYVMVLSQQGTNGVQRFAAQPINESLMVGASAPNLPRITNTGPDGFDVSGDANVNAAGVTYHYIAFKTTAGVTAAGSYAGDGASSRNIAGMGFRPDYVLVRGAGSANQTLHRTSANGDDTAMEFVPEYHVSGAIRRFLTDGFEVGTNSQVNAPATTYYWLAFRDALAPVDASIVMAADRTTASLGDSVNLEIVVSNESLDLLTGLQVTNALPPGLTYTGHTVTRGNYVPGSGVWTVGSLIGGESVVLDVAAAVAVAGPATLQVNTVVSALDQSDGDPSNNSNSVTIQVINKEFRVTTGSYTGDGGGARAIAGLGFAPDVVLITGENGAGSIMRTATMPAGRVKELSLNNVLLSGAINSLDPDGFTAGNHATANAGGVVYHWTAFQSSSGSMKIGTYTGDDLDDRSITGVGFQPGYLILLSANNQESMQRFASMGGDASATFGVSGLKSDRIQAMEADGFQVGRHNTVNQGGVLIHYVAWKDGAAQAKSGLYIGNGGASQSRHDVGIRPLLAIICRQTSGTPSVQRPASVTGNMTLPFTPNPPFTDGITALTSDGFDLGSSASVNEGGVPYYWSAFRDNREADLVVVLAQSDTAPNVGDTLTLDTTVNNQGPSDAGGLEITAPVPAGTILVSATPGSGSFDAGSGKWTIATLANGGTTTLSVRARVSSGSGGSTLVHAASITATDAVDPNSTNDAPSANIYVQAAQLAIDVYADTTFASVGDTLRFHAAITNDGPNDASGIIVTVPLPAGVSYVGHAGDGSWVPGTGAWTVGSVPALGAATFAFLAVVSSGMEGQQLTVSATLTASDQEDPVPQNNADAWSVRVITPVAVTDVASSLYPASASAGQPALALRIGADNTSGAGVTLATTSTISFSDGISTYVATLKNPTYVPPYASDFILAFNAAAVPVAMTPGTSYDLRLALQGTTAESWAYADTFLTTGRNTIFIAETEMVVSANIVGDATVRPGAAGIELLRLEFQSSYTAPRTLDSLVVTNTSTGAGAPAELDGLARAAYLYGDMDGNGTLSAPDSLLGIAFLTGGRAVFDVGGGWTMPPSAVSRLIVAADVDSMRARDGDVMDVAITFESDIVFLEPTTIAGTITPLDRVDSYGTATIDGMVAMQVAFSDAGPDTLSSGDAGVWIATVVLPTNGYADDVLNRLEIADFSGSFNKADLAALDLVHDDGDGVYIPGVDLPLGRFAFSGDRYQLSGLSAPVAVGNRFFLVAGAGSAPGDGDTFRPGVPVGGAEMASGDDGPIDVPVLSPRTLVFRRVEEIAVDARTLSPLTVNPGRGLAPMLWFDVKNNTTADITVDSLLLTNASTGSGSVAELDRNIGVVRVYTDNGDGVVGPTDTILATGLSFSAGSLSIPSLGIPLPAGAGVTLLVTCDVDSSCAADGDLLAVSIAAASHLSTTSVAPVTGAFPVTTTPRRAINGLMAHQVRLNASADSVLVAGSVNNVVLDVRIHGNGYSGDVLQSLTVENLGTATDEHFSRLALFVDGGNGSFDAGTGDDVDLGNLSAVGSNRFRLSALSTPLPGTCGQDARFYVSADVVASPPNGASVQLTIPTLGIAVASGNDGPIDLAVVDPTVHLIPRPDELTVFPYSVGDKRVRPATINVLNFGVGLYNGFDSPLVLGGMQLFQKGSVTAAEILRVRAWSDSDFNGLFDPSLDALIATTTSTGVFYPLSGIDLTLPPKKISYVFVTYDLSLSVRDSVSVNLQINTENDMSFPNPSVVQGEFPIDSPGQDATDGMIAAQIPPTNAPNQTVPPGDSNVFVLGFTVPRNGLLPDLLEHVTIGNAGTAAPGQDIVSLNLWAEDNGDGTFDAAGDRLVTSLIWNGSGWRNPSTLGESIPEGGLRCYVSADMAGTAVDGRTIRVLLPVNALRVASGNDGPIDRIVVNPGTQVVSTVALIASLSTDRVSYSVGQTMIVTMGVRNVGGAPLTGVSPGTFSTGGTGSVTPAGGPVPASVDLAPGETSAFVWTFTAAGPGDPVFCGFATDSVITSVETCSDPARIQNRASSIAAVFDDHAPPGVNRGQRGVPVMRFGFEHTDPDTLAAAVRIRTIAMSIVDNGGAPIAPNSVLSGMTLVSSSGVNAFFGLADSTLNPVHLTFPQSLWIDRGRDIDIDVVIDVAASAALVPFRLVVATGADLGVVDVNDGTAVGLSPSMPFPWLTNAIDTDEPATLVRVSDDALSSSTANFGQRRVVVWDGTLENASPATGAGAAVTSLMIDFHDGTGSAITPSDAVSRLAIFGGGTKLLETGALSPSSTVRFDFPSALLIPPQVTRSLVIEADIQETPGTPGVGLTLRTPAAVAVRDNNSGVALDIAVAGGASFPLVSRTISFQPPATALAAAMVSLAPETILPSDAGIPIARLRLTHADATGAAILVDSLALLFRAPDGAAFYPGNYFNRILVLGTADTLATLTTLSSVSSLVPCRLSSPMVLGPAGADSLTLAVDAKSSYVPGSFVARIDRELIHAVDANDPGRAIGISGVFPMQSNTVNMRLPGNNVDISILSAIPSNVAGNERALPAMDISVENRSAPGFTAARVESLTVAVQGRGGSPLAAGGIVEAARLMEADSLVCVGAVASSGIVFRLPANFTITPGARRDFSLVADLTGNIRAGLFRFAIVDATAVVLSDAVTFGPVQASSERGFPLATNYATVLSADEASAFTNYPNPFAAGREPTRVTYFLDRPSRVTLRVFTLWGSAVTTLAGGARRSAGLHQDITWDGRNGDGDTVNNGVYYLVLDIAPDGGSPRSLRRKVAVLR